MSKRSVFLAAAVIGPALVSTSAFAGTACEANFKKSGNPFIGGMSYSTSALIPDVSPSVAFSRAHRVVAEDDDWSDIKSDPEGGVLTATSAENYSKNNISMTIVIERKDSGVKVLVRAQASGELPNAQKHMCKPVEAIVGAE